MSRTDSGWNIHNAAWAHPRISLGLVEKGHMRLFSSTNGEEWSFQDSDPPGYNALHYVARLWRDVGDALDSALLERLDLNAETSIGQTPLTILLGEFNRPIGEVPDLSHADDYPPDYAAAILVCRMRKWLRNGARLYVAHDRSNVLFSIPDGNAKETVDLLFEHGAGWAPDVTSSGTNLSDAYARRPWISAILLPKMESFRHGVRGALAKGMDDCLPPPLVFLIMRFLFAECAPQQKRKRSVDCQQKEENLQDHL